MKPILPATTAIAALCASISPLHAQETDPVLQDRIIVTGKKRMNETTDVIRPDSTALDGNDITAIAARLPGGGRIGNGALSGQMAYRGLFGERLNLRVDGQRFASGGPNLMDPVFHYAPSPLVEALEVDRGVSPVSAGQGLAGGANAVFKKTDYADSAAVTPDFDLTVSTRSVNSSANGGGIAGLSTDRWRVNLLGAAETGSDSSYRHDTIGGTSFERNVWGLSAGFRHGASEVSLDMRRQNTGPSGNPPFPMDIVFFDTDFARLGFETATDAVSLEASLHYTDVSHLMDNYSQRPDPGVPRRRATDAFATTKGADAALAFDWRGGEMKFGTDWRETNHDVTITNPDNDNFYVTPFPQIVMEDTGLFAEWTGPLGPVRGEAGLRLNHHAWNAGETRTGPALPAGPSMLASQFDAAATGGDDTTFDAVLRLWRPSEEGPVWRATFARKAQQPGYIQRFGWLPINASGGLADGNIYVGDPMLEPETAWITEAGFDHTTGHLTFRPTLFVRQVDNYIQGTPYDDTPGVADTPVEMIAAMNGDPTPLKWTNTGARLYGADFDAAWDFNGPLYAGLVASVVHGERTDIDDNLYRVAPPSLTASLGWAENRWSVTAETRAAAAQKNVSAANDEKTSPAFAIFNIRGDILLGDNIRLDGGVENLFDTVYREHLSGLNRNGYGDVPLGERVPGDGRGLYLRMSITG